MIHKMMNGVSQWPRYSNTHSGEQLPTPYANACVCVCVWQRRVSKTSGGYEHLHLCVCVCVCESVLSEMEWHSGQCCGSRVKPNLISDHISPSLAFILRSLTLRSPVPHPCSRTNKTFQIPETEYWKQITMRKCCKTPVTEWTQTGSVPKPSQLPCW